MRQVDMRASEPGVNWQPTHSFVITLPRRTDRHEHVAALQTVIPELVVVEGVDGRDGVPAGAGWLSSPGAWGNRESHRLVLEKALDGCADTVLVLEDDARLAAGFADELTELVTRLPRGWEAVMLGGEHLRTPGFVSSGIVLCRWTIRTHAYLLRGSGVTVARDAARSAVRHWDYRLAVSLGARCATYAPDPFLVQVTDSPSDVPDSTRLLTNYRMFPPQ